MKIHRRSETSLVPESLKQSSPANVPRTGLAAHSRANARRLHRKETAVYLGVSISWLDKSRLTGLGPVFIRIGNRVVYDTVDLDSYMDSNRRTSTSSSEI
jgi:hypothetical protein